jgi:hypothetical protein
MKAMISVAYATGRNVLEICETGEQGGLIVGSESSVKLQSLNASLGCIRIFNSKMTNS